MNVQDLVTRHQAIDVDIKNCKQLIFMLSDQLETQKTQLHILTGHSNEVRHQIEYATKEAQQKLLLDKEGAEKKSSELEEGHTNGQTEQ